MIRQKVREQSDTGRMHPERVSELRRLSSLTEAGSVSVEATIFGGLLGVVALLALVLMACVGSATLAECRLNAVSALPVHDPDSLSVGDVRELARALKACQAPARADAGE